MRSKIFQEIWDETPEDVEIFVRLYADLKDLGILRR